MRAEIIVPVRVRLTGVATLDEAKSFVRHIVELGTEQEGYVGLPMGVKLEGRPKCDSIIRAVLSDDKGEVVEAEERRW